MHKYDIFDAKYAYLAYIIYYALHFIYFLINYAGKAYNIVDESTDNTISAYICNQDI